MKRNSASGLAILAAFAAGSLSTAPAHGQANSYSLPANMTLDKLGVEIGSMVYEREDTFLSIGNAASGGLSWEFIGHDNSDPFEAFVISSMSPATPVPETQVKIGGRLTVFIHCEIGSCQNFSGSGSTLVKTSTNWIYTTEDGSTYTFDNKNASIDSLTQPIAIEGQLLKIRRPSGVEITVNYVGGSFPYRIRSVVSSAGYALKYSGGPPYDGSISAVNLSNHTCDAVVTACDGVDTAITFTSPNVTSSGTGETFAVSQITDAAGGNWQYSVYEVPKWEDPNKPFNPWEIDKDGIHYFKSAAGYEVTVGYDEAGRIIKLTDNRGAWTYAYPDQTLLAAEKGRQDHTISVTDPSGALLYTAHADPTDPVVGYVQDPLNDQTQFGYQSASYTDGYGVIHYTKLNSVIQPEGNSKTLAFDTRWNVTSVTDTPKPSSGLAPTSITASYPATCTNPVTCNKPTWTKDALGNETDYTYDPTHGGVLSEMSPAPAGTQARPLKLTTWIQKTPYYKNASGVMTSSGKPVWVVSTETQCQTLTGTNPAATCDPAAPIRVTTYQYLADSAANSLWPHGVSVAADGTSRLTCFTYDALGNKISETKPLGAPVGGVCP